MLLYIAYLVPHWTWGRIMSYKRTCGTFWCSCDGNLSIHRLWPAWQYPHGSTTVRCACSRGACGGGIALWHGSTQVWGHDLGRRWLVFCLWGWPAGTTWFGAGAGTPWSPLPGAEYGRWGTPRVLPWRAVTYSPCTAVLPLSARWSQ